MAVGRRRKPQQADRIEFPAEVAQLVEQWSEEPCVASSILALGTVRLFAGLFVSRVFDRAAQARRKQMVRALRYTMLEKSMLSYSRRLARHRYLTQRHIGRIGR